VGINVAGAICSMAFWMLLLLGITAGDTFHSAGIVPIYYEGQKLSTPELPGRGTYRWKISFLGPDEIGAEERGGCVHIYGQSETACQERRGRGIVLCPGGCPVVIEADQMRGAVPQRVVEMAVVIVFVTLFGALITPMVDKFILL
jgi:hypothetical protein